MTDRSLIILETKGFTKKFDKLVGASERLTLYHHLEQDPISGDVIAGSGGIRKLRWSRPGMGKRGGVRILYYYVDACGFLSLLTLYAKNEQQNLAAQDIKFLRCVVEQIESQLKDRKDA